MEFFRTVRNFNDLHFFYLKTEFSSSRILLRATISYFNLLRRDLISLTLIMGIQNASLLYVIFTLHKLDTIKYFY